MLDAPFWGVLLSRLHIIADPTCDTMWTDGVSIGYSPAWVDTINDFEVKGTLVHEVLHVANGHCWRIGFREHELWNEAADYSINPIIDEAGYILPEGVLRKAEYNGKPAELIYELLKLERAQNPQQKNPKPKQSKGSPQDGKDGQPGGDGEGDSKDDAAAGQDDGSAKDDKPAKPGKGKGKGKAANDDKDQAQGEGSASGQPGQQPKAPPRAGEVRPAPPGVDRKELEQQWQVAVSNAATFAASRGDLPGYLKEFIDGVKNPTVDWKEALWQFVQQSYYSPDYRWTRPNRNYMSMGIYLPSLVGEDMPEIVIADDTSFSVFSALTKQFRSEMSAILEQMRPRKIYHLQADTRITKITELEPGDEFDNVVAGRGGTDFRPVFKWVAKEGHEPACLLYMSDLDGPFPDREPDYPVLWVCPPGSPNPPWGLKLEMSFDEYN